MLDTEIKVTAASKLYRRLRAWDRQSQMAIDLVVLVAAFWFSYLLRFDFRVPPGYLSGFGTQLPLVLLSQILTAYAMGIYSFVWRFVGITELKAFAKAALIAPIPLLALRLGLPAEFHAWKAPLSIIILDTALAFGGMLGARVLRRVFHERKNARIQSRGRQKDERVLILGAGHTGLAIAKEISSRGDTGLEAVGFLDDDEAKTGSMIGGTRVLGKLSSLEEVIQTHSVDQVILAIAAAQRETVRRIVSVCDEIAVPLRVVPAFSRILDGSVSISRLRPVQIEDLLGRDPVELDASKLDAFLSGKRILVTGAGGSIGSEISRQVLKYSPSSLLLVERAEYALFELMREFERERTQNSQRAVPLVADAGDERRMRSILANFRPEVIIHAAAHKHVPLMEQNVCEAVDNNVATTDTLSRLAGEYECDAFVLISTDKAVRPASIMGATKRAAEMLLLERNSEFSTRYVAVRFGNVLGSTGSVIPIFEEQISAGGPVTVTHPKMVRYFMTIAEASQLVLQAGSIGRGGEILILDMGEPVSIVRLAEDMIRLSGLIPYEDVDIVFSGARPGEKIVEELSLDPLELDRTEHPKIFVSSPAQPSSSVRESVRELLDLASLGRDAEVRRKLTEMIPEASLRTEGAGANLGLAPAQQPESGEFPISPVPN